MIHALLDTNVVLDALLDRTPWNIQANAIWQAQLDKQFTAYVTATTLTDIFYISHRYGGLDKAWRLVHAVLNQLPTDCNGIKIDFPENLEYNKETVNSINRTKT